jgi:DUF1680 family protein
VNLFVPSSVKWTDGSGRYALTQQTKYPLEHTVQIQLSASRPFEHTLNLRIPAWAEKDPILSVNGKRVASPARPGSFASIRRTWKDGDRVELELPMALRLEPVDASHANLVALVHGPLVLFAVADPQPSFEHNALLQAKPAKNSAGDWIANSVDGSSVVMRPFMSIDKESYSTYVLLKS